MAQLKDLNVAGQSRFVGDVYANNIHGTLDSGGTASQLVAGNGTLQQIVSAITDSTTGVPNPKAVYDYVEANTIKKESADVSDEFLSFTGEGLGIITFTESATQGSGNFLIIRDDLYGDLSTRIIKIHDANYTGTSNEWYPAKRNGEYGFWVGYGSYTYCSNDNLQLVSTAGGSAPAAYQSEQFIIGTIATQAEIDALFTDSGSSSI